MMQLPLTYEIFSDVHVIVYDVHNEHLFGVYGDNAIEIARAVINAVNERPGDKAEIARLRELISKWR